ncbi:MAG: pilus assembly protein PilZ [Cellvibrionaceae bacterium]|nr:pilus assembly protein PilZ [Cellvibrionaceae bacterium]|tara:strand:- start:11679 stop:12263 length:585 start_codon:yes stop_codon:yes gene_type:complete
MNQVTEKRNFFRINSDIIIDFHNVDNYTAGHTSAEAQFPDDTRSLNVFQELKRLDREASAHLSAISELSRSLADYLTILNKKVDLAVQQHFADQSKQQDLPHTHANLSEGGIAFTTNRPIYKGSQIALQLRFLWDFSTLACFAKVMRCDPVPTQKKTQEDTFKVACKFQRLNETQQEIIGRHIIQAQIAARRTK